MEAISSSSSPPLPLPPPFGSLRLTSQRDILKLGIVCTASFRYSEQFDWERTHHEQFPQSTMVWYRHSMADFICSPRHIVLVAVDSYEPDESSKTKAIIPADNGWKPPEAGSEVVVGIGVWRLETLSRCIGRFQNDDAPYPTLPVYDYRDLDQGRAAKLMAVAMAAEERYIPGLPTMERILVHSAYCNRGHGSTIARWGTALAQADHVSQGVVATKKGAGLFSHVGYNLLTHFEVEGDEACPEGVKFAILKYTPAPPIVPQEEKRWCILM
ncbi:hypothetical protein NKR19_g210 [Coniochaeta hoffmannii]|uniref:N-acetyltransferase domain-containing protein n=1 Tax=Coniochaeta hoffmannii TaxID=91930 RepID=A0AA38SKT6_9PEZI|nr:hypothetical protein NKR19_g210 [Coniochaeta hoffmannii]